MTYKTCARCGGSYRDPYVISGGMYNVPKVLCRCADGPAASRSRQRNTYPSNPLPNPPRASYHPPQPPGFSLSINPGAIWQETQKARSSVTMPPLYYVAVTSGVLIIVSTLSVAALIDSNAVWIAGLVVGLLLLGGSFAVRSLLEDEAVEQRMQQLARSTTESIVQGRRNAQNRVQVVPLSQRPKAPCRECGSMVIAGSSKCHRCGFSGFQWECNSCSGPLVMTDIGLMYCNRCQGYWR